jgi:hypothetical protein
MPMYTHAHRPGALPLIGALEADVEVRLDPGPEGHVRARAVARLQLGGHMLQGTQGEVEALRAALGERIAQLRETIALLQQEGLNVFVGPLHSLPTENRSAARPALDEKA